MSTFLRYTRGELKQRALHNDLLQEVVFGGGSDLRNIEITTLKQHLRDEAAVEAWAQAVSLQEVDRVIEELLSTSHTRSAEFVWVKPSSIVVGVNAEQVDDNAIDHAIVMLTRIDNLTTLQFTKIGEEYQVYEK